MSAEEQIIWSENCVDPGCRVFFIGKRVFRAYEESRKQETLDFLNSECYAMLLSKQMVVKTWVAEDIRIADYPLILEHERLCCMPEKWLCFEMLKDILAFHFEVNTICNKYGYGLRDIGFGNVTLNKGKLCFTDFGSFRKLENIDLNIYEQYCLPLAYLPLAIYSRNDGNDFIADSLINDYDKWITSQTKPIADTLLSNHLRSYLHPITQHYDLRIRRSNIRWRARTRLAMWLVQKLNDALLSLVPSEYAGRNLIEINPIYSAEKADEQLGAIKFPYQGESLYPIKKVSILQFVPEVISQYINRPVNRIVLWGNFRYEEIMPLRKAVIGEIIVMSSDRIYCNHLYEQIRSHQEDMVVICCNVMRGKDFKVFGSLKTDILIMQDEVYKQVHIGSHSDWAERASHFSKYVLTPILRQDETQACRIHVYYGLKCENPDAVWQLYENRHK